MNINEKNFRLYFPEKNIYLMRNHKWAFSAWEIERLKDNIKKGAVLLHVDYHTDFNEPGIDIPKINSRKEALEIGEKLEIMDFIQASISAGTLGEVFMISDDRVSNGESEFTRAYTFNHFENEYRTLFFQQANEFSNDDYILDIDLDFFNSNAHSFISKNYDDNAHLYSDEYIKEHLVRLKDYTDWKVITIAISPEHCGGIEEAMRLYKLTLEVFQLEDSQAVVW